MDFSLGVRMNWVRVGCVVAVFGLAFAELSCGDTFRPVAIPITPTPPTPSSLHYVLSLSENGMICPPPLNSSVPCDPGASTRIDVAGDSEVAVATTGVGPVYAVLLPNGSDVFVANQVDDSVSLFSPSAIAPISTISLPAGSSPAFIGTAQNNAVYVANPGNNTVSVISTANNIVTNTIAVGISPMALAEMPSGQKLYVANRGSGTNPVNGSVNSINLIDNSVNPPIANSTWNSPTWIVARSDNGRIYVLDQGTGVVSAIDTSADAVVGTASVQAGANYMVYEPVRNRLYVTNPVAGTLTILDASSHLSGPTDPLTVLSTISFAASAAPNAPCPSGCIPISVAPLPDTSRVYVASYQVTPTPCTDQGAPALPACVITAQVTVVNASNYSVTKTIPITLPNTPETQACDTARFRLFAAAAGDSSRVYVSYCDAGSTAVIRTTPDTSPGTQNSGDYLVGNLSAPVSAAAPPGPGLQPPPQNPVFVLAGP